MPEVFTKIVDHEKIISVFGRWPSFHDSEVVSVFLNKDEGEKLTGATATIKFYLFDLNRPPADPARLTTLTDMQFFDVQNFSMQRFTHQNAISDFVISESYSDQLKREVFGVELTRGTGFECSFNCSRIRVNSVQRLERAD